MNREEDEPRDDGGRKSRLKPGLQLTKLAPRETWNARGGFDHLETSCTSRYTDNCPIMNSTLMA